MVFDIRAPGFRVVDPYVIPGAVFAAGRQLDGILATYPRDGKVVIYCACPDEVSAAWMAARLREAGFRDVLPLRGGIGHLGDVTPADLARLLPALDEAVDEVTR